MKWSELQPTLPGRPSFSISFSSSKASRPFPFSDREPCGGDWVPTVLVTAILLSIFPWTGTLPEFLLSVTSLEESFKLPTSTTLPVLILDGEVNLWEASGGNISCPTLPLASSFWSNLCMSKLWIAFDAPVDPNIALGEEEATSLVPSVSWVLLIGFDVSGKLVGFSFSPAAVKSPLFWFLFCKLSRFLSNFLIRVSRSSPGKFKTNNNIKKI